MRAIDADILKEGYDGALGHFDAFQIMDDIDSQPTLDVRPVIHARWEMDTFCSHCGWSGEEDEDCNIIQVCYDFCPGCGAVMDLEEEK